MRRTKFWFSGAIVAAALVMVAPTTAAPGAVVDEGWRPVKSANGAVGRQAITMMDSADYADSIPSLRAYPQRSAGRYKTCTTISDANCAGVEVIEFSAVLQPCATETSLNCIAEFGVVTSDGAKVPATFQRNFPAEAPNKYPADDPTGLPVGASAALWQVPSSVGLTNSLHFVRASVMGKAKPGEKFEFTDFSAAVHAVSMTTMACTDTLSWSPQPNPCTSAHITDDRPSGNGFAGFVEETGEVQNLDCVMTGNPNRETDSAECALRKALAVDQSYYLTLRLAQSPQGWLHGRLSDADVTITPISGSVGAVAIAVRGKPVRVPAVFKEMAFSELPADLKEKYAAKGSWPSSVGGSGYASSWGQDVDPTDGTQRNRNSIPPSYGPDGIAELEAWLPHINDTSTADRATWTLRTLSSWERQQANKCIEDKSRVTGLVFTNATQYLAGAPTYNATTKSLDYKVSAPHKMSSGEVFKGSYQLLIRSDVAKCIYGFSGAAMKATVSVIESDGGEASTAVTNVSESDGWFRLSASGFTHSTPIIRAVFAEGSPASGAGSGTPTLRAKKSIGAAALARAAGLTTGRKSRITIAVSRKSSSICRVGRSALVGVKAGRCAVTVTVVTGSKRVKRSIEVRVR